MLLCGGDRQCGIEVEDQHGRQCVVGSASDVRNGEAGHGESDAELRQWEECGSESSVTVGNVSADIRVCLSKVGRKSSVPVPSPEVRSASSSLSRS